MQALMAIAAISGFVLLFLFIIRWHKKHQAEIAAALTQAGYQTIPQLESDVAQVLEGMLAKGRTKSSELKNIYRYAGLNYDLYRFDVPGNESDTTSYAMAFRQSLFPPFALMPNFKLPGFLSTVVNKLLQMAVARREFKEVEVPGKPRFQERYRLFARDAHLVLSAIPAHIWDRLTELPGHLCLQGEGRVLLLTALVTMQRRSSNNPKLELRSMVDSADALARVFGEIQPQRVRV
jgi:hypothetical protein